MTDAVEIVKLGAPEPEADVTEGESFDSDRRITPTKVYGPLYEEFRFTIDVAADIETTRLPRYFAAMPDGKALGNGLEAAWAGERVWCNPPYSKISKWISKAWRECAGCPVIVMLVPAWTDRAWWAALVEPYRERILETQPGVGVRFSTRFPPGRTRFGYPGNAEGKGVGSPKYVGSALLIWERL